MAANPFADDPLPAYTSTWGPGVARPATLPLAYDRRVDPAHIFVFAVHPVSGIERDFYVTPRTCVYCTSIRQACSKTRPRCWRCVAAGRACDFVDGWSRLSGFKPKLKAQTRADGQREAGSSESNDRQSRLAANPFADAPLPQYTSSWGPRLARPATLPDPGVYGTRVDAAHVFVFPDLPGPFYVVPLRCAACKRVRAFCSRARPACERCAGGKKKNACADGSGSACTYREGWERLEVLRPGARAGKRAADGDGEWVVRLCSEGMSLLSSPKKLRVPVDGRFASGGSER